MAHGNFTTVSITDDDTLFIEGENDGPDNISAIDITIVAIDNRHKFSVADPMKSFNPPWTTFAPIETEEGSFAEGDLVVAIGSATHTNTTKYASPFQWYGIFRIQAKGSKGGEVQVVAVGA